MLSAQRAAVERVARRSLLLDILFISRTHYGGETYMCALGLIRHCALSIYSRAHSYYTFPCVQYRFTIFNTPPYIYIYIYYTLSIYHIMFNNFLNFSNLSLHTAMVKISAILSFESILINSISFSFTLS